MAGERDCGTGEEQVCGYPTEGQKMHMKAEACQKKALAQCVGIPVSKLTGVLPA